DLPALLSGALVEGDPDGRLRALLLEEDHEAAADDRRGARAVDGLEWRQRMVPEEVPGQVEGGYPRVAEEHDHALPVHDRRGRGVAVLPHHAPLGRGARRV